MGGWHAVRQNAAVVLMGVNIAVGGGCAIRVLQWC